MSADQPGIQKGKIIDGKRLIAEFMGGQIRMGKKIEVVMMDDVNAPFVYEGVANLKYHSSWNWQVPAWNKVYKLLMCIDQNKKEFNQGMDFVDAYWISMNNGDILTCFSILVKAIKFVTQNK